MKVNVKGTKIILSETPVRDVIGAFFLIYKRYFPEFKKIKPKNYTGKIPILGEETKNIETKQVIEEVTIDVHKGQKEYDLPEGVAKKDIEALYLRVL